MLKPEEAKSLFRTTLTILITNIVWPLIAGIAAGVAAVMEMSMGLVSLTLVIIWLALLIWLIVQLFKAAPHAGVTPWAFLWLLIPVVGVFLIGMLFLEPLKYIADNKPAGERLPLTWSLIKESWKFFYSSLQQTIKTSVYFLYVALILGLSAAITILWTPWTILHGLLGITAALATLWIGIKLFLEIAALESDKNVSGKESSQASSLFGSYLWVTILVALITIGPLLLVLALFFMFSLSSIIPALGGSGAEMTNLIDSLRNNVVLLVGGGLIGMVLFVCSWIWAIYKSIQYALAIPALLVNQNKGMAALQESARVIKKRWWGMFWKNQLWGIVVGGLTFVLMLVAGIIMVLPALLLKSGKSATIFSELLAQGAQGAIQMLIMPLAFIFIIKLYSAFKKTAK